MTAWEYGFLYQIHTTTKGQQSGPTVYVVDQYTGTWVINGVDILLMAINYAGAQGWLIDLANPVQIRTPAPRIADAAYTVEGADMIYGHSTVQFAMRREAPTS